jgi:two-component system response regulator VicR
LLAEPDLGAIIAVSLDPLSRSRPIFAMPTRILLADDDEMIVDVLQHELQKEGFEVLVAFDGETALELARTQNPDLVLLDVMMPRLQGFDVCREIRRESTVPILMLTAGGEEMDRIIGLDMGADDYVVKPFSLRELMARIRANLRRVELSSSGVKNGRELVQIGPVTIDRKRHAVSLNGEPVSLSQREYDLLVALLGAKGAVMSRSELLDQVWGKQWVGDPRTLDVHIRWLREKIEPDPAQPRLVLTVRGVGYRLVTPDELAP